MFVNTLNHLICPHCQGMNLKLHRDKTIRGDVKSGSVNCVSCQANFPIFEGVLIWSTDPETYLAEHVTDKDNHIEHIDESLESDRVTALYWLGHYVSSAALLKAHPKLSPTLKLLIKKYWDYGPMQILKKEFQKRKLRGSMLELGCGSGGLAHLLGSHLDSYLGVDFSFQGIKRAREILISKQNTYSTPGDLINGPLGIKIKSSSKNKPPQDTDFIVMDLGADGLKNHDWDFVSAFNVIDMMNEPKELFQLQKRFLKPGGTAICSSPYIWHPETAKKLKPKKNETSPDRILRLADEQGLKKSLFDVRNISWLFFKNINQIEIYNVHLFGVKNGK